MTTEHLPALAMSAGVLRLIEVFLAEMGAPLTDEQQAAFADAHARIEAAR